MGSSWSRPYQRQFDACRREIVLLGSESSRGSIELQPVTAILHKQRTHLSWRNLERKGKAFDFKRVGCRCHGSPGEYLLVSNFFSRADNTPPSFSAFN